MFQHKIISILFKISASALFLKFRKFQPRYSYKIYSYKHKRVISESLVVLIKFYFDKNLSQGLFRVESDLRLRIHLSWREVIIKTDNIQDHTAGLYWHSVFKVNKIVVTVSNS